MISIDLNADVGEMDGELDARLIEVVSSVSIACGGHAGDDISMAHVARTATEQGVRIGAHPSYPDPANFGRVRMDLPAAILRASLREQIQRLAANSPAPLAYVKPHGALYHAAAIDEHVAHALVEAADGLALMGQQGALYLRIAASNGLQVIQEGFADRAYSDEGSLVPRTEPGAVLHSEDAVLAQVTDLARGQVRSITGRVIRVQAHSVCLHSDTPGAADLAHRIASHLQASGVEIRA